MQLLRKPLDSSSNWSLPWTLRSIGREARLPVQLVFGMRFAATASLARNPSIPGVLGLISWLSVTVAIYLLNGLSDVDGDRLNRSGRPLARGHLSPTTAKGVVIAAAGVGVVLACAMGRTFVILAVAMLALGFAYSFGPAWKKKPVLAGATIGAGAGLTYAAGWAAGGGLTQGDLALTAALAAWTAISSSTKDFSDVAGDRIAGRRTLPIALGPRRAATWIIAATSIATVALLAVTTLAETALYAGIVFSLGSARIPLGFRAVTDWEDRRSARKPYRAYMSTQYAATCAMIAVGI